MTDLETVKRLCRTRASGTEQAGHANKCPQGALDRATQALKDAAVHLAVARARDGARDEDFARLTCAAEDYADVYLRRGK